MSRPEQIVLHDPASFAGMRAAGLLDNRPPPGAMALGEAGEDDGQPELFGK